MVVLTKGIFSLDLGLLKISGELTDEDRQCAWALYIELSTRVALTGKPTDYKCENFEGEVYIESLNSFYLFFQEAREILRSFPIGSITTKKNNYILVVSNLMQNVLRPFLEKWQSDFNYWWEYYANNKVSPFERQREYPYLEDFLKDWSDVRFLLRKLREELISVYKLPTI
jgi:hypothetical protein